MANTIVEALRNEPEIEVTLKGLEKPQTKIL